MRTPKSSKKVSTPTQPKEFAYRRQNRLLRSEQASMHARCTQLERIVEDLKAQLMEERDKTIAPLTIEENSQNEQIAELRRCLQKSAEDNEALKNQLAKQSYESSTQFYKIENLQSQLGLLRCNNEDLRKSVSDLSRELVHHKQSIKDNQKRAVAANSKADIYQLKLHEAFKENGLLKKQLEEAEQARRSQDLRQKANVSNLITKAEDLLNLLELEKMYVSGQK